MVAADRDLASAEETVAMARQHGDRCTAFEADVTRETTLAAMVAHTREKFGRIDVLHYNVGLSIAGGDAPPTEITEAAFDRVIAINLRGCVMAVKHVLPVMRAQQSGVDPHHLVARGLRGLSLRRLQGDQGGDDRLHAADRDPERALWHPRQLHPAGPDGYADGGGHPRPRTAASRAPRWRPRATPRCRCAAGWAPPGTSPTPRCFSPPTRPISSPAWRCRSMAARWSRSGEASA